MPSFDDARRTILASVAPAPPECVPLLEAAGRVLAEEIVAPWNMPFCDNSAMDGFAVRSADCVAPARLKITGYLPAGAAVEHALEPGCAIRIMTGAPIPPGCDAVVAVEETEESGGEVFIRAAVKPRQQIRFTGEDVAAGDRILSAGAVLHPPAISLLASLGRAQVAVSGRPRVAILSTGDELIELGEPIAQGKVVNSNAYSLAASVQGIGALPLILGIARDEPGHLREKLIEGFQADALITSAGVSAGDRDYVRDVLCELEVRLLFHEVKVKPGGPTAFGLKNGKPIFALSGNPVATMVIFEELVRPALLKMMGHRRVLKAPVRAILQEPLQKKPGKVQLFRVRLERFEGGYRAYSAGDQNTGILTTMLRADGLAILPAEATSFAPGDELSVHPLSGEATMLEESALQPNAPGSPAGP
jgi:molybdopterin molybdotransferase